MRGEKEVSSVATAKTATAPARPRPSGVIVRIGPSHSCVVEGQGLPPVRERIVHGEVKEPVGIELRAEVVAGFLVDESGELVPYATMGFDDASLEGSILVSDLERAHTRCRLDLAPSAEESPHVLLKDLAKLFTSPRLESA